VKKFTHPLINGLDANTNLPVFGLGINDMFVTDPYLSSCGRFKAEPTKEWGISREEADQLVALNKTLDEATQAALNAGCLHVQNSILGAGATGDVAGVHFSASETVAPIAQAILDYMKVELAFAQSDEDKQAEQSDSRPQGM